MRLAEQSSLTEPSSSQPPAATPDGGDPPWSRATSPSGPAWHALPAEEALAVLESAASGLSQDEARRRLARVGPNQLRQVEGAGVLEILWRQIASPMIYVLLASAFLAMVTGKGTDAMVILGVVVVNALIGFFQEFRAGRAIRALMEIVPDMATVVRDGVRHSLPAAEVVPGDVVVIEAGDKVPADLRVLAQRSLRLEEAMLTGESQPIAKHVLSVDAAVALADRRNVAFGGTLVVSGSGTGVAVATGAGTELGRISALLQEADTLQTPLMRQLGAVGRWLAVGIVTVAGILLVIGFLRGYPVVDALLVAVTLAVAAIPEGLPAIVTIALAIGVQRMARRKALIRSLPAAETLGATTVICSDKTGTLTRNEMTVKALHTQVGRFDVEGVGYVPVGRVVRRSDGAAASGEEVEDVLRAALLAGDARLEGGDGGWKVVGDPTEGALVVAAQKAGLDAATLREAWPRLDAIPFESERRFMATLNARPDGGAMIFAKGAPEAILARCVQGTDAEEAMAWVEEMAAGGMRVLAVAAASAAPGAATIEEDDVVGLRLLGMAGMIDPPRPEAIEAIRRCHEAGITVKMITGDHRVTAMAIGRQLGLVEEGARGVVGLELEGLDTDAVAELAARENIFARVAPEHKLALVRALQRSGHVVAMTGDGVNDSPALRQADIGVAMGITGTGASKEAADIVLADDNFATIAAAVEEGRRVYDNLVKSLAFVIPTNLGLALILLSAVTTFPMVAGRPILPMTPTQALWINLVAAVALALPLAFEAREPRIMQRPPRRPGEPIMGPFVLFRSVLVAVLMTAGALGVFLYEYSAETGRGVAADLALREAQTMAVTTVVLFQIFYLLNCRSLRDSIFRIGLFSNPAIFLGIGAIVVLQATFVYHPLLNRLFGTSPLSPDALATSLMVALTILPVISVEKWWRRHDAGA